MMIDLTYTPVLRQSLIHMTMSFSLHSSNTDLIDRYYDHLPPMDDGIIYEDIGIDPNTFTSQFDNQVCMISTSPNFDDERDMHLMYPHLIDGAKRGTKYRLV